MVSAMLLDDAIGAYISQRAPEWAEETTRSVRQNLRYFQREVGNMLVKNITDDHVSRYCNGKFDGDGNLVVPGRRQELEPTSFNRLLAALRGFFRWCQDENLTRANPVRRIRTAAETIKPKLHLEPAELREALEVHSKHPRDRALVALAISTGLRANDITRLLVGNLDLHRLTLRVAVAKSKKEEEFPVNPLLDREMRRWLSWYCEQDYLHHPASCPCGASPLCGNWYLVPAKNSYRLDQDGRMDPSQGRIRPNCRISDPLSIAHRILTSMGVKGEHIGRGEGMHTFRRSAAQLVYDAALADADSRDEALDVTQAFLIHSHRATTERYLNRERKRDKRDQLLRRVDLLGVPEAPGNVIPFRRSGGD